MITPAQLEKDRMRKVRTADGKVGRVVKVISAAYSSVETVYNAGYHIYKNIDLEDMPEEEFWRVFR